MTWHNIDDMTWQHILLLYWNMWTSKYDSKLVLYCNNKTVFEMTWHDKITDFMHEVIATYVDSVSCHSHFFAVVTLFFAFVTFNFWYCVCFRHFFLAVTIFFVGTKSFFFCCQFNCFIVTWPFFWYHRHLLLL